MKIEQEFLTNRMNLIQALQQAKLSKNSALSYAAESLLEKLISYFPETRTNSTDFRFVETSDLEITCEIINLLQVEVTLHPRKRIQQVLENAQSEICVWLKTHLETYPEVRQSYSDIIQARVPSGFPWQQIRPKPAGLAILYNFSPFQDTGATVASKRIREFAESVDVVACSFLHKKKTDLTVEKIAEPYIHSRHFISLNASWASWEPFRAFIAQSCSYSEALLRDRGGYDFLYTRAMWAPSIYAGAEFKIRHPEIKWIAEFSDPMSLDVEGLPRGGKIPIDDTSIHFISEIERRYGKVSDDKKTIFALAELLAYALADEIIFTNENQKTTMLQHIDNQDLRARVDQIGIVSHHPTLPRSYYELESSNYHTDNSVLNLGYFGEFYSSRSITEVTAAIRALPRQLQERVHLHIFTNYIPDSKGTKRPRQFSKVQYEELVSRAISGVGAEGIENNVHFNASLPYLKFLSATDQLDYLIVNDARSGAHHSVNPYLPSKWSDYKGSMGKTLAFIEADSVLSKQSIENKIPVGDISGAREALWAMIIRKFPDALNSGE